MPLDTLIADTRKAITEDPARAQAAFTYRFWAAQLGIEVDSLTEHCPVLDLFRNPVPVSRSIVAAR
jgi:hypothetical protein